VHCSCYKHAVCYSFDVREQVVVDNILQLVIALQYQQLAMHSTATAAATTATTATTAAATADDNAATRDEVAATDNNGSTQQQQQQQLLLLSKLHRRRQSLPNFKGLKWWKQPGSSTATSTTKDVTDATTSFTNGTATDDDVASLDASRHSNASSCSSASVYMHDRTDSATDNSSVHNGDTPRHQRSRTASDVIGSMYKRAASFTSNITNKVTQYSNLTLMPYYTHSNAAQMYVQVREFHAHSV
jgi:hypothetical protein